MPAAPATSATVETGGETKTIDVSYPLGERAYFRNFPGRYRLWVTIHVIAIHVYSGGRGWSVDNVARLLWDAIPLHKSWKSAAQCQRFRKYIEEDVYESYPFFVSSGGSANRKHWHINVSTLDRWRESSDFGPGLSAWAKLVDDRRNQDHQMHKIKMMSDFLAEISHGYCQREDKVVDFRTPYSSAQRSLPSHPIAPVHEGRHGPSSAHPPLPGPLRFGNEFAGSSSTETTDTRRRASALGPHFTMSVEAQEAGVTPPGLSKTDQAASSVLAAPLGSSSLRHSNVAPEVAKCSDLPQFTLSHLPAPPAASVKATRPAIQIPLLNTTTAPSSRTSDTLSPPASSHLLLNNDAYPSPPTSATSRITTFITSRDRSMAALDPTLAGKTAPGIEPPRLRRKAANPPVDPRPCSRTRRGESPSILTPQGHGKNKTTGHDERPGQNPPGTRNVDSIAFSPGPGDLERNVIDKLVWFLQLSEVGRLNHVSPSRCSLWSLIITRP
ncbi:hypothetical protein BD410DRAFT_43056 [Rickenella mellea]|uniref:Uncharacterized protein n=1 Tax=Rickenella mellea TaxID=50990 RepID=A0A4R5XGT2_9AGAM|nr:hypothetical protein BD410DRAFT_43056 [Rickenella mellea]